MGHAIWTIPDLPEPEPIRPARWVRDDLVPGEALVWQGRPGVVRPVLGALPWAMFGAFFGGIALVIWYSTIMVNQRDLGPALFSIPFVLLGGFMALTPVWAGWRAWRTRYAITTQRVIVRQPRFFAGVQTVSLGPASLANTVRNQRFGGRGDLIFERPRLTDLRTPTAERGFFGIAQVRNVEKLLRATLITPLVDPKPAQPGPVAWLRPEVG